MQNSVITLQQIYSINTIYNSLNSINDDRYDNIVQKATNVWAYKLLKAWLNNIKHYMVVVATAAAAAAAFIFLDNAFIQDLNLVQFPVCAASWSCEARRKPRCC